MLSTNGGTIPVAGFDGVCGVRGVFGWRTPRQTRFADISGAGMEFEIVRILGAAGGLTGGFDAAVLESGIYRIGQRRCLDLRISRVQQRL
jgi:hypothetical protein